MLSPQTVIRHCLHLILPVDCAGCGAALAGDPVPFFCRSCWSRIAPLSGPACPRCGRPFASSLSLQHSPGHLCEACRTRRPAYTRAWSGYPYEPPLQDAIHLFKYRGKVALARALGALLQAASPPPAVDVIMPVPLHPARLRDREFNQALLLADRLAGAWKLPVSCDNLYRVRPTASQTELTRAARLKNLRRAFALRHPDDVAGRRILLVDDVFTTGTTVNECAKALRRAGAADVYVYTLARKL